MMTHIPDAAILRYSSKFLEETRGWLSRINYLCPKRAASFLMETVLPTVESAPTIQNPLYLITPA